MLSTYDTICDQLKVFMAFLVNVCCCCCVMVVVFACISFAIILKVLMHFALLQFFIFLFVFIFVRFRCCILEEPAKQKTADS